MTSLSAKRTSQLLGRIGATTLMDTNASVNEPFFYRVSVHQ